jgi:hypothetical protein
MSKVKLKFDERFRDSVIAIYPKPANYKTTVLKAIENRGTIPAVNEVFRINETFLQEFPELEGFVEIFQTQEISKANVIIDRRNSNVSVKGTSREGEIDLKQSIEYANNSGTYTVNFSEDFSGSTDISFLVSKQNVPISLPYFDTILDITEVDVNGAITRVEFNNSINISFRNTFEQSAAGGQLMGDIKITEGNYYIQGENNLLIRVEIGYIDIEGKKTLAVKNHEILNGGNSYEITNFRVKIYDGYSELIVKQTLTNGTWSIPSEELIEGFYYNISFYAEDDSSFSGTFERVDNKFKYLERIKRVAADAVMNADNIMLQNPDMNLVKSLNETLAKDYDGVIFSNPCECKMVDSTGYMFLSGDTSSENPEDVQVYIYRGQNLLDGGMQPPIWNPDGDIRPTPISQVVRPEKFLMKNIVLRNIYAATPDGEIPAVIL